MEKVTPKKIKWLPIILAVVVVVAMLGAGAFLLLMDGMPGSSFTAGADDLYWNVDRVKYDSLAEGGASARNRNADGYYHITFANSGEVVELLTEERKVVNTVDTMDICGLEFDENGLIIGCKTIEELGYVNIANRFYVQKVDGTNATINSSIAYDGIEMNIDVTENVKAYDMSGALGVQSIGMPTKLMFRDRLIALEKGGQLSHVFVFQRSLGTVGWCEHCQMDAVWSSWDDAAAVPSASGHYILEADINTNGQARIEAGQEVILDLNGHQVKGADAARIYLMAGEGAYLAIFDTSAEKTGKLCGSGTSNDQGGLIWVRYGTFDFYGGTIDGAFMSSNQIGALVHVHEVAAMNMYDGAKITGGVTRGILRMTDNKAQGGVGGNMYIDGIFNMYGGIIENGQAIGYQNPETKGFASGRGGNIAAGAKAQIYIGGNSVIKGGTAYGSHGGNIYCGGKLTIAENAQIYGGKTTWTSGNGGNIFISAAGTMNLKGGIIRDGRSFNRGGNVGLAGVFNMSGGTITGGQNVDPEGNIRTDYTYVKDHNVVMTGGTAEITGGLIEGYFMTGPNIESIKISGTAQITGAAEGDVNLFVYAGKEIELGELKEGAKIGITGGGFLTTETDEANLKYLSLDYEGLEIQYYQNKAFAGIFHCLCGKATGSHIGECKGQTLTWAPWLELNTLPNKTGNYFLLKDLNLKNQTNINAVKNKDGVPEKQHVNLDLNGKTITGADGKRAYLVGADAGSLTITDTHKNPGKIVCNATKDNGMVILSSGKVNIYNGILDGSKIKTTGGGAVIRMAGGGELNMYGGQIVNGTANNGGNVVLAANATNNTVSVFNMYGGTISGGHAKLQAGNVYVGNKCTFNMYGGEILDGTTSGANGGNVGVTGTSTFNMHGGLIRGGFAGDATATEKQESNGGNIYVAGSSSLNISGGEILDGKATNRGGNIRCDGKMTMSGGKITGGLNTDVEGVAREGYTFYRDHNVLVPGHLDMSGGLIEGYVLLSNAKNTYKISGTAQVTGGERNLFLANNVLLEVGELAEGANIGVTLNAGGGVFSKPGAPAGSEKYFVSDAGSDIAITDAGELFIGKYHCLCGVTHDKNSQICDGTKHIWSPVDGTTNIVTSGYYYLVDSGKADDGITEAKSVVQVGSDAARDLDVVLDMNGLDYKSSTRAFQVWHGAEMTIYNSKETGGTITGAGANKGHTGVILLSNYDAETKKTDQTAVLNLIDVNVTLAETENVITEAGAIKVTAGCTLNAQGGTITGGTVTGNGGTIYVEGGDVVLNDTDVIGGTANNGGAICVAYDGTVTMNGATTVSGGTAKSDGGNIYIGGGKATVTMNDTSSVFDGREDKNQGGNLSSRGVLNMNDEAQIYGGKANGANRNIRLYGGSLTMTDKAAIDGGVTMSGKTDITLSDTVRIVKLDEDGNPVLSSTNAARGLYMGASVVIDATGIKEGAQIAVGVNKETKFAEIAKDADAAILTCFLGTEKANGLAAEAVVDGEKTYVVFEEVGGVYHCLCGNVHSTKEENGTLTYKYGEGKCLGTCDGTILSWSPWDGVGIPSGNVYLTKSKTDNMVITGGSFNLDLNGFNFDFVGERKAIAVAGGKGTINISNSSDTESRIYGADTRANTNGGVIALTADYTLNLYNVNIEAETQGATIKDGGAVYISNGTFSMYGGTVKGIKVSGNGGAVYIQTTKAVTLENVAVSGGEASWGGNIYAKAGTTLNLTGTTTVTGGKDGNQAGNVYSQGTVNIADQVEVSGGKWNGTTNRNLRMENDAKAATKAELHVSGNAYIDGGVTVNGLKAITLSGTPTICQIGQTGNPLNAAGLRNLRILNGPVIDATGLEAGALISVGVDMGTTFAKVADDATADIAACFMATENASGSSVSMETVSGEKVLIMRPAGTEVHCICGSSTNEHMGDCTGEQLLWTAWDGTVKNGNFYLTSDRTSTILVYDEAVTDFNLDLHGHDIKVTSNARAINIGKGSMTVCDTVGGSQIVGYGNGGNAATISQWSDKPTSLTLYGVDVAAHNGGNTINNGGVIYVSMADSHFEMYGGTLAGCTAKDKGGAMAIVSGATVHLEDVTIAGGISSNGYGDAIYLNNGTLTLGGTIVSNEIYFGSNTASKIVIDDSFNTADSEVWVDMATVTMPIATDVPQDYSAAFKSNKAGYIVVTEGTQLKLAEGKQTIEHCLCGSATGTHLGTCDGTVLTWEPWDGTLKDGNYYLTANRTTTLTVNKNVAMNLDLNGYSFKHVGSVAPLANVSGATLNVCNSSDDTESQIYGADNRGNKIGAVITNTNGHLTLFNVDVVAAADSTISNGGAINVSAGSFQMYGGSVVGRTVSNQGGAIYVKGNGVTVTLKDVQITAGSASQGGGIYADGGADVTLQNVDITASGTNVTHGGGIYAIGAGTMLEMTDCTVAGTHVVGRGGCLALVGGANATLKNVTMNGGDCDKNNKGSEYGKDIYLNDTITLDGTVKIGELCMGDAASAKILIGNDFDTTNSFVGISRITSTKPLITDLETDLSANFGSTNSAYATAYDAPNKQLVLQAAAAREQMNLRYDDRVELNATSVQIVSQNATSYAVGTTTKDAAVLTYTDGKLIATGVGTAVMSVDGKHYDVTVEAAPISLFMITGHSVGEGSAGDATQSVVVEAGQAYSSHIHAADRGRRHDLNDTTVYGLGYGAANRVKNISTDIALDGFAAGNGGSRGEDSGLAYRWNKITGEKVWVLNCAYGGSGLSQWTAGGGMYEYAVNEFKFAQKVLTAEVAAGHYILKDMAIIYHSAANATNFADTTQTYMNQCYVDMWNGYKTALSTDITGDGQPETVKALGLVPIWTANGGYGYSSLDKAANYLWAASKAHPDVFMASLEGRKWLTTADVLANFPAIEYTTQSNPVAFPESVIHINQGGTSANSVFCAGDVVHYAQVGYNAQGMVVASNLYEYLRGTVTLSSLRLMDTSDNELAETVTLKVGQTMTIVPVVEPITVNDLEFAVTGNISADPAWVIKADAVGTGTITVSRGGQVLKTITVTVEA